MGFNVFGNILQSLWVMLFFFFASKDIPCGVIPLQTVRFSRFSSACYFDICLHRFFVTVLLAILLILSKD